ncbi:hypothetical protein B0H14DRAFT_2973075 [Mycena olivaceomarginata]|nr:hypothetical protein B0H14DRAFT_2973075 [Mycena olivaceomarginata]
MWEKRRRLPSMESASAATSLCSVTTASAESLNFDDVTPRTSLETCPTSLGGFSARTGTNCAALRLTADRPALTVHPRAGPVRLVGRGGQGSRPRLLDSGDSHPAAPTMHRDHTLELLPVSGGGQHAHRSRPRELPALTRSRLPPLTPPATTLNPSMTQPVFYRPGGRGGAGSKSRAAKSSSEAPETGKGKATGNASTYGAPSLTRTDTMDTTSASLVDFLPAHRARQTYQSTMAQDFILEPIPASNLSTEVAALVSTLRRRHQDKTRERSHAGPVFLALRLLCHTTVIVPMTTPSYAPSAPRARSPSYASHQTQRMTIISMIICTAPPPQLPLQSTSISQCRSNLSMIQDLRASLLTVV